MEGNVKKNFIFLSLYKLFEMLLPMITSPLLSRRLGAESLGKYTYYYSIVSMFVVVAELGSYKYGIREIAKVRENKKDLKRVYSEIFFTRFFNGLIVGIAYILFLYINKELYLIQISMALFIISNMIDNSFLYIGIEKVGPLTLRDSLVKIVSFILIVLLINNSNDLVLYVLIMEFSTLICRFISLFFSLKYVSFEIPNIKKCLMHYKPMLGLTIPTLAAVIYQSMDRIMIGYFYNNAEVGYYDCASKVLIPRNIITALGTVLCPSVANLYYRNEIAKANKIIENSFMVSMILSYAFMFGISAIAYQFAPWFWGDEFFVCSPMIVGLSITIPIWTVGEVIRNQYLLPIGKDKEYIISFLMGVGANAIANCLLIQKYGANGAIFATILSETIMSLTQVYFVRKQLKVDRYLFGTIPYFIIGLIMFSGIQIFNDILTTYLKNQTLLLLIEVIFGSTFFMIAICLYENITNKHLVLKVIRKKGEN